MARRAAYSRTGAPPTTLDSALGTNVFDWLFSNPFEHESSCTPSSQRVPRIEDSRPVFVDNASGTYVDQDTRCWSALRRRNINIMKTAP